MLEKSGHRISQASDGTGALAHVAAGAVCSLVLTDLHMHEMDGDEVRRRAPSP
jgi:CheY-like chemotaxis protein